MEKRFLRPDGSVRWAEVEAVAMWPEGDTPVWHMAIVQDVTERRRAEKALRDSERHQQNIAKQLEAERTRLIEAQTVAKVGSREIALPSLQSLGQSRHRIFETDPSHFRLTRPTLRNLSIPKIGRKWMPPFRLRSTRMHPSRSNIGLSWQTAASKSWRSNGEFSIMNKESRSA